jgi:3-oxoacyl-[acyl-carrier-protein] synthase-3
MKTAKILGVGSYSPSQILTNKDLEKIIETTDEWIWSRTGIRERRVAPKDEITSDLALKASQRALEDAGINPEDLDLVILGTTTPDMIFPATACFVQAKLGTTRAAAFDLAAACSSFIYGLSVANCYIRAEAYQTILVIGVEIMTRIVDWTDRNTCVLFGDGAGAAVVRADDDNSSGILSTHIYSDGNYTKYLYGPGGGTLYPASHESIDQRLHYIKMNGNETFKGAVKAMTEAAREALIYNNYQPENIDLFIPHQANQRIIDAVAERLQIPTEKTFVNVDKYGNTSSASIPIALDEAIKQNKIKPGDLVLLASFGAGFTWGSALIRW